MKVVHKYQLRLVGGPQVVQMPADAHIVHVHEQDERPTLWAYVDIDRLPVTRVFSIFATGQPIEIPVHSYVGTIHVGWTVWHVYEDVAP